MFFFSLLFFFCCHRREFCCGTQVDNREIQWGIFVKEKKNPISVSNRRSSQDILHHNTEINTEVGLIKSCCVVTDRAWFVSTRHLPADANYRRASGSVAVDPSEQKAQIISVHQSMRTVNTNIERFCMGRWTCLQTAEHIAPQKHINKVHLLNSRWCTAFVIPHGHRILSTRAYNGKLKFTVRVNFMENVKGLSNSDNISCKSGFFSSKKKILIN